MGIEYRAAVQGQAMLAPKVDAAHAFTAGVHQACDTQRAVVDRDVDGIGLEAVADGQVTLLELEAAGAEDFAVIEALVERCKLLIQRACGTQALSLDFDAAALIRHKGATGIVITAVAAQDLALQIHHTARRVQRHGAQFATLVVFG